ncbi:kinesin-domain-containing protein [Violaceomyces palustris]|uniref:Kinesin-domain-containing protein n=1 Tax=Violaceomyces palustris TaxID=1673888 RepID=A0ACD0NRJ9_9BASI|nr:kinesin-domain-containing protein [Violaceomyces palustris]
MPPSRQETPMGDETVSTPTPRASARSTRSAAASSSAKLSSLGRSSKEATQASLAAPTLSKNSPLITSSTRSRTPSARAPITRGLTAKSTVSSSIPSQATTSSRPRSARAPATLGDSNAATPTANKRRAENSAIPPIPTPASHPRLATLTTKSISLASEADSSPNHDYEPIKAFLRIRPIPQDSKNEHSQPYIQVINNREVLMHAPKDVGGLYPHSRIAARSRLQTSSPATKYAFSRVFGGDSHWPGKSGKDSEDETSQQSFFKHTTLPMVQDLLQGQSGLVFTYGVTNSGKSYTVQGGTGPGEAGILPRSLDVIFNSIEGLESSSSIRPMGLSGVEKVEANETNTCSAPPTGLNPFAIPGISKRILNDALSRTFLNKVYERDETKVKVDRNLRYSVWVSFVEVYNEKLFDLLDASPPSSSPSVSNFGGLARSDSVRGSNWSISAMAGSSSDPQGNHGNITLNRRPLTLKNDFEGGGKYVAGLREIKVANASEARELLRRGQENRAVFGTMANRASSRSHGVFTIKIIREHAGASKYKAGNQEGEISYSTSRLSIVDLAGSERLGNTGITSGERLKEAGNINKSLMCLGQCLETLRKNQARAASFAAVPEGPPPTSWNGSGLASQKAEFPGSIIKGPKRRPSIVPFRHSKLTELFQSFFTGEGRAVMIVNANPYDTGFDENSHVMKFSAVAKEVTTARPTPNFTKPTVTAANGPSSATLAKMGGFRSRHGKPSRSAKETTELEEDSESDGRDITIIEGDDDDSEDEVESDPFVDLLVQKHEELRQRLFAAEMRCAMIESEVREEMANEMEQRLLEMENLYNQRMLNDAEQTEDFVNKKIDLLVKANINEQERLNRVEGFGRHPQATPEGHPDDEAEVEHSLGDDGAATTPCQGPSRIRQFQKSPSTRSPESESDEEASINLQPGRHYGARIRKEGSSRSSIDAEASRERLQRVLRRDGGLDSEIQSDSEDEESSLAKVELEDEGEMNVEEEGKDEVEDVEEGEEEEGEEEDEEEDEDEDEDEEEEEEEDSFLEESDPDDKSFEAGGACQAFSDAAEETSEDEEQENRSRRKSAGRGKALAAKGRASIKRQSMIKPLTEKSQYESNGLTKGPTMDESSDLSLVVEEKVEPKKKRKLRKKAAMQEDDMVEQIGDSSLVEAVQHSNSHLPRSTSRKSIR